jgi:hypothetical protein
MDAPRSSPGPANIFQILAVVLTAGIISLPLCLAMDDFIADNIMDKLTVNLEDLQAQPDNTILEALSLQKECSDELLECRKAGALADRSDRRCFSICITLNTGCRSCCSDNTCYEPSADGKGLGSCSPCPDGGNSGQCVPCFILLEYTRGVLLLHIAGLDKDVFYFAVLT